MSLDEHSEKQARLPRRRRSFSPLDSKAVREVARQVIGASADDAEIIVPVQGINNQTYLLQPAAGPGLVIKLRPRPDPRVKNSPQWPRYSQHLFGPVPNGDISTLMPITADLGCQGAIRVPRIHLVDTSLALVPAPYFIGERLAGTAYDWENNPIQGAAARQLGEHLSRLHRATQGRSGGIYAAPETFTVEQWWPRFARAYCALLEELARGSALMAGLRQPLERALARAVAGGTPEGCALICVDQNPTHYLGADGGLCGMVDVEAHLRAPREYELAMVELWVRDVDAFQKAYRAHLAWPETMDCVRPAYQFLTWMEWIYCLHTLIHDHQKAAALERHLGSLCARVMAP